MKGADNKENTQTQTTPTQQNTPTHARNAFQSSYQDSTRRGEVVKQ